MKLACAAGWKFLERKIRLKIFGAFGDFGPQSQTTCFAKAPSAVVDVRSAEAKSGIWPMGLQDLRRRGDEKGGLAPRSFVFPLQAMHNQL